MSLYTVIALALSLKKHLKKSFRIKKDSKGEESNRRLDKLKDIKQTLSAGTDVIIRDFAYAKDSPLHFGNPVSNQSNISLSSPDFTGREGRAMYDFIPETENEIELEAGQLIWIQYRQCPGWLIADVQDQTGLVPESYVEFI